MKRRHRVVVEITLDKPCTEKEACWHVNRFFDCSIHSKESGVTKYTIKQFNRVVQGLLGVSVKSREAYLKMLNSNKRRVHNKRCSLNMEGI